jgi:hypothetical protein
MGAHCYGVDRLQAWWICIRFSPIATAQPDKLPSSEVMNDR